MEEIFSGPNFFPYPTVISKVLSASAIERKTRDTTRTRHKKRTKHVYRKNSCFGTRALLPIGAQVPSELSRRCAFGPADVATWNPCPPKYLKPTHLTSIDRKLIAFMVGAVAKPPETSRFPVRSIKGMQTVNGIF